MTEVKRVFVVNTGHRIRHEAPEGVKVVKVYNKALRRLIRADSIRRRSRIERALLTCREEDVEIADLATNSHQRQRAIAADRIERAELRLRERRL